MKSSNDLTAALTVLKTKKTVFKKSPDVSLSAVRYRLLKMAKDITEQQDNNIKVSSVISITLDESTDLGDGTNKSF